MPRLPKDYLEAIKQSGLTIYDPIEVGDPRLWIPSRELEAILDPALRGMDLGYALRTRSKVVKSRVCEALGYPVPASFRKTQPRFPGQCFDTYVQKSNNLQVWNEELSSTRRYVLIRLSALDLVERVKVVTGDTLAELDTTGTLTQKYQAGIIPGPETAVLVVPNDTDNLRALLGLEENLQRFACSPTEHPTTRCLLPIRAVFNRLRKIVGRTFADPGHGQERNRGAVLHGLVCQSLGYADYRDDGRFPDVRNQLLEVKLQTSPTIDLGLVRPDSTDPLDIPKLSERQIRHCDVRYAVFYGTTDGDTVTISHFYLTTGESFFGHFRQFRGKVLNRKLQIPLPGDFFTA
jgi:hypothetical protein